MLKEKYLKEISEILAILSVCIDYGNKLRFFDSNISCESFYKDFLNIVYGYNLKNINIETPNYPAVDLGDENISLAIQVTSDSTSTKIKNTIKKFVDNELFKKYKKLRFYIITSRQKKYSAKFNTKGHFVFDPNKDIIDNKDLIKFISQLDTAKVKEIRDFLDKEIGYRSLKQKSSIANEVITIMELIELLSNEGEAVNNVKIEDPDPDYKIYKRFADYAENLITELKDYIPQYKTKKEEAERVLGMDAAKTNKIGRYLKTVSIDLLHKNKNDPKKALDALVSAFEKKLSSSGNHYDFGAIRYYLLNQIVQCNVFPNPPGQDKK
ncbi:MAG: SMEK domain-containing protein [Candidatus Omnitrophica bacterium]|nr:SMEK domain-containing protein [Candidatus Omnitrophota bacterium]